MSRSLSCSGPEGIAPFEAALSTSEVPLLSEVAHLSSCGLSTGRWSRRCTRGVDAQLSRYLCPMSWLSPKSRVELYLSSTAHLCARASSLRLDRASYPTTPQSPDPPGEAVDRTVGLPGGRSVGVAGFTVIAVLEVAAGERGEDGISCTHVPLLFPTTSKLTPLKRGLIQNGHSHVTHLYPF